MTSDLEYVLDANVFIEASNRYYAFDLKSKFWESLIDLAEQGRVASIDQVREELLRGKDQLASWAKTEFSRGFASTVEDDVIGRYKEIMTWVQAQGQYFDAAKSDFARGADGWLVAYALVRDCAVVTHEQMEPEARKRVPIPNVCRHFDVSFLDTFNMLRRLGVRLS